MAKVSKEFATLEKNGHTYNSKMEFSIRGLVNNEFGPSLYRIEKAIQYLKDTISTSESSTSMES